MPSDRLRRTVIKDPLFEQQLQEILRTDVEGADEFIRGVEEILSRAPELGRRPNERSSVWLVVTNPSAQRRSPLVIFYTWNDSTVNLLSIHVTEPYE